MDSHLLFELTYVLYRIRPTIVHGERWLMETPREFRLFYPPCERWFRNLAQGLFHNNSSCSLARGTPTFSFVRILFLTRERLAGWSSRLLSVYSVFFIIGRDTSKLEGDWFCFAHRSCFFKSSISRCMAFSSPCSWAAWPFLWKPLWTMCRLSSWWFSKSFWCLRLRNSSYWRTLADSAWCELVSCGPDPAITVILHWSTSSSHRRRQL